MFLNLGPISKGCGPYDQFTLSTSYMYFIFESTYQVRISRYPLAFVFLVLMIDRLGRPSVKPYQDYPTKSICNCHKTSQDRVRSEVYARAKE